jgi:glycosyltransferase involved in cell wall biosynthesis
MSGSSSSAVGPLAGEVVDLVLLGAGPLPEWGRGAVLVVADLSPAALATALAAHLGEHRPDAVLLWDRRLGPPPDHAVDLLAQPDDVWHAGLALGTAGQPACIDLVAPTWMLNADPDPHRPATSWRLSLSACLVRTPVLRSLGGPDPTFDSLTGAGLELGHRWIGGGALCRHEPALLHDADPHGLRLPPIGAADQQRFALRRFGTTWARYVTLRSRRRLAGLARLRSMAAETPPASTPLARAPAVAAGTAPAGSSVTVVIPTVDRYPWLTTVLGQLAEQTVAPGEVLVVDQTPVSRRRDLAAEAPPGLPLRVLVSEVAGQCTARNLALAHARGDLLLFLDDDDELPPDLLARHLARLAQTGADANCGIAVEPGEDDLDPAFRRFRQSDVFPTNNTLLRREALTGSGLFDLAFDRGERADHDLGMRLYLSGHRLVLDPEAEVLHHHAAEGGLRAHAARVDTYRGSRHSTVARHRLAPTELYLWRRYYRPDQVREALRLRLFGTFSRRGRAPARALRVLVQLALLRDTRAQLAQAGRAADALAADHPTIPVLGDRS